MSRDIAHLENVTILSERGVAMLWHALGELESYRKAAGRAPSPNLTRIRAELGRPTTRSWVEASPSPQGDIAETDIRQHGEQTGSPRFIPSSEAAELLGVTHRQVRRLAPRLGGQLVAGRWLIPRKELEEHLAGQDEPE